MNSRSPSARSETNASAVRACPVKRKGPMSTPPSARVCARNRPNGSSPTLPMKALLTPSRASPTATLAGAPPGAFLNAGASIRLVPVTVGTKSISSSPRQTTSGIMHRLAATAWRAGARRSMAQPGLLRAERHPAGRDRDRSRRRLAPGIDRDDATPSRAWESGPRGDRLGRIRTIALPRLTAGIGSWRRLDFALPGASAECG